MPHVWHVDSHGHDPTEWSKNLYSVRAAAFQIAGNLGLADARAEALPWRCHRRLIADQFVARGWRVFDIMGPGQFKEHTLPEFAKVVKGRVTYPGRR